MRHYAEAVGIPSAFGPIQSDHRRRRGPPEPLMTQTGHQAIRWSITSSVTARSAPGRGAPSLSCFGGDQNHWPGRAQFRHGVHDDGDRSL